MDGKERSGVTPQLSGFLAAGGNRGYNFRRTQGEQLGEPVRPAGGKNGVPESTARRASERMK